MTAFVLFKSPKAVALVCGVVSFCGLLSSVSAHPSKRSAKPVIKPLPFKARQSQPSPVLKMTDLQKRQLTVLRASQAWLNRVGHPTIGVYEPIPAAQVSGRNVPFSDTTSALILEPDRKGVLLLPSPDFQHLALSYSDGGYAGELWLPLAKEDKPSRPNSESHLFKMQCRWIRYAGAFRTIAGELNAENVFYPTPPHLTFSNMLTGGNVQELSAGRPAYSSEALGQVYVRGRKEGRELVFTPHLEQHTLIANWVTDRLALELMSPFHGTLPYEKDQKFEAASRAGNLAAAEDVRKMASSDSSAERAHYAERAFEKHRWAFRNEFNRLGRSTSATWLGASF